MKKFNDTWQEVKIKSKIHILHDFLYIKQGNMCSKWLYFLSSCEILLQVILLRLRRYLSIFSEFSIHMISKIRKLFWKRVYKDQNSLKAKQQRNLNIPLYWYLTILYIMLSMGHYIPYLKFRHCYSLEIKHCYVLPSFFHQTLILPTCHSWHVTHPRYPEWWYVWFLSLPDLSFLIYIYIYKFTYPQKDAYFYLSHLAWNRFLSSSIAHILNQTIPTTT